MLTINNKGYLWAVGIFLIVAIIIGGYFIWLIFTGPGSDPIVGGDKDEHGCIGSAGYSWCEVKNKCLRVFEESCEANTIDTSNWQTATLSLGVLGIDGSIEYKYPSDWKVAQNMNQQYLRPKNNRLTEEIFIHVMPVVVSNPYEFIPPTASGLPDPNPPIKTFGNNSFFYGQGQFEAQWDQAYEILNSAKTGGARFTLIVRGGRQQMDYYIPASEIKPEMDILAKILESFKFVK